MDSSKMRYVARTMTIREAEKADFSTIKRIAVASFPVPVGWADRPDRSSHYGPSFCCANDFGVMRAIVAVPSERATPVGYCLYQVRNDGDVYIYEIAANPPNPEDKLRRAGSRLLRHVVSEALSRPIRHRVTANVSALYRATFIPRLFHKTWRDPLPFYSRLGFVAYENYDGGYTYDTLDRDACDTWLEAVPDEAWRAINAEIEKSMLDIH